MATQLRSKHTKFPPKRAASSAQVHKRTAGWVSTVSCKAGGSERGRTHHLRGLEMEILLSSTPEIRGGGWGVGLGGGVGGGGEVVGSGQGRLGPQTLRLGKKESPQRGIEKPHRRTPVGSRENNGGVSHGFQKVVGKMDLGGMRKGGNFRELRLHTDPSPSSRGRTQNQQQL